MGMVAYLCGIPNLCVDTVIILVYYKYYVKHTLR